MTQGLTGCELAGPAGCALAYGLAQSPKAPKILLLEAGGENSNPNLRVFGQRWLTMLNPEMNLGYKTTPQPECDNREMEYARGKGLGGSSAINFGAFTVGPRGDYDEWSRLVGDESFSWEPIKERFKRLVTFHPETPTDLSDADAANKNKYASPNSADHGTTGPLQIGYAPEWEEDFIPVLEALAQAGCPDNPDLNSGNPIGVSPMLSSSHRGSRVTAKDLLSHLPVNVIVKTGSPVQRVKVERTDTGSLRAVGVQCNGTMYVAAQEVILAAGSLDSPRILMHSGIGPAAQLAKYHVPVALNAPAVGQGLRDHAYCPLIFKRTQDSGSANRAAFFGGGQAMTDAALEQWRRDGTGPLSKYGCTLGFGFLKFADDTLTSTPEFAALPQDVQNHLRDPTVPHYEIATHTPVHWFLPWLFADSDLDTMHYQSLIVFLHHAQSRGTAELQSADPNVPLHFNPRLLEHPFDRRMAIEALRSSLALAASPGFAKDTVATLAGPEPGSEATDEELLQYWRQTVAPGWHMAGTLKMGQSPGGGDGNDASDSAVVDSDFRVFGVDGLRVADLSVLPVLPSCHPQSVACKSHSLFFFKPPQPFSRCTEHGKHANLRCLAGALLDQM